MFTNCFKYTLPALLTVLIASLTGCSDDEFSQPASSSRQISFNVTDTNEWGQSRGESPATGSLSTLALKAGGKQLYLIPEVTKSVTSDAETEANASRGTFTTKNDISDFGVYASGNGDNSGYYMENVEIKKDNSWTPEMEYLWPGEGTLHINAYSPYCSTPETEGITSLPSSDPADTPEIGYIVPSEVESQTDLLWSTPKDASSSPCDMMFNHALASVRFITGAEMTPCTIKRITISSLKNSGTLNLENGTWDNIGGSADYTAQLDLALSAAQGSEYVAENAEITDDAHRFILMPQSLSDKSSVTMVIDYEGNELEFTASLAGQVWTAGNTYTYRLSANPAVDRFVLTVDSPLSFTYAGGSLQYNIKSIHEKISNGTVTSTDVPWTAEFIDDAGNVIATPDWIKSISMSGKGDASYDATTQMVEPEFVSMSSHTQTLRNNPSVGTSDSPYNLSNATGAATVENTANCYVINAPGFYSLPLVYGNAITNGADHTAAYEPNSTRAPFVNHLGNHIKKPYIYDNEGCANIKDAVLIWEGQLNLVRNVALSADRKNIVFDIPAASIRQGNALIGVRDESGTIMWSWQIWVTDYVAGENLNTFTYNGKPFEIMPINLGRVYGGDETKFAEATARLRITQHPSDGSDGETAVIVIKQSGKDVKTPDYHSFYQWGRKDPMMTFVKEWYNADHSEIAQITTVGISSSTTFGNEIIEAWIKAPQTFYYYGSGTEPRFSSTNNWNAGSSSKPVKTVFDPCPVGFRIPGSEFLALSQQPEANYSFTPHLSDGQPAGFHITDSGSGDSAFFAAFGYLSGKSGNQVTTKDGTSIATFWTSHTSSTEASAVVLSGNTTVDHSPVSDPRLEGFGVRPVKE